MRMNLLSVESIISLGILVTKDGSVCDDIAYIFYMYILKLTDHNGNWFDSLFI